MMNWQSIRSVIPPCPGIESPKSLTLNVRLSPEAKKPPKGAMSEAKVASTRMWNCIGLRGISTVEAECRMLYLRYSYGRRKMRPVRRDERHLVSVQDEDRVDFAFQSGEHSSTEVLLRSASRSACLVESTGLTHIDRTDEILVSHENVRQSEAKDDGEDPRPEESFDGLLRADLDELRLAERDTAHVGKDVVGDDKRHRQEKPYHALEDVVHDEVGLHHDQVECHVSPCELCELELVMPLFQRYHKKDEA